MPLINRASLPEEFFDITSAMLLVQPEPQYLHAMLFKQAIGAAMQMQFGGPRGLQVDGRPIADKGDAYTSALYDRLMLAQPDGVYSAAIRVEPDFSKAPGHTVRINRPKFGSGGFTEASRSVPSGTSIGTTAIDLSSEQVPLTMKRYAGPYDAANSAVAPFAIDKFDAGRALHSVSQMVGKHMQRDFDKWLDAVVVGLLGSGSTTLWPGSNTSDNNAIVAGDMPGDVNLLFRAEESLKSANIPRFSNGRYMAVITPTFSRQLKDDPQFARYAKYFPEKNPLYQSYVATVGGLDIFESNTLSSSTSNTNSVAMYTSQVFGPEMAGAGLGRLPEVMPSTADNYGETALVIWLSYLAFGVLDNRFGVQLHTN